MSKNVLITGASSGIGEAAARYLTEQHYNVILVARNEERLKKLVNELGENARYYIYDFKNLDRIEDIFIYCKECNLMLDGLVHCAGYSNNLPVKEMEPDILEDMIDVHANSYLMLGKYMARKEYSNRGASIVGMSSMSVIIQKRGMAAYTGAKTLINTYTTIMAKEFVRREIRVNSIMPAYVNTPMLQEMKIEHENAMGMIEPEYVAYLIEYLLSDKAKYITGAHIPMSSGMLGDVRHIKNGG
ncbi:MAG: SDR family oxidoreductase [Lachnospiraceae bacterium]|nr:SDR family oxidoreductase [Lachnospiraceae bacterium]